MLILHTSFGPQRVVKHVVRAAQEDDLNAGGKSQCQVGIARHVMRQSQAGGVVRDLRELGFRVPVEGRSG